MGNVLEVVLVSQMHWKYGKKETNELCLGKVFEEMFGDLHKNMIMWTLIRGKGERHRKYHSIIYLITGKEVIET